MGLSNDEIKERVYSVRSLLAGQPLSAEQAVALDAGLDLLENLLQSLGEVADSLSRLATAAEDQLR